MIDYVVGISVAIAVIGIIIRGFRKKDTGCGCGCSSCANSTCGENQQHDSL